MTDIEFEIRKMILVANSPDNDGYYRKDLKDQLLNLRNIINQSL